MPANEAPALSSSSADERTATMGCTMSGGPESASRRVAPSSAYAAAAATTRSLGDRGGAGGARRSGSVRGGREAEARRTGARRREAVAGSRPCRHGRRVVGAWLAQPVEVLHRPWLFRGSYRQDAHDASSPSTSTICPSRSTSITPRTLTTAGSPYRAPRPPRGTGRRAGHHGRCVREERRPRGQGGGRRGSRRARACSASSSVRTTRGRPVALPREPGMPRSSLPLCGGAMKLPLSLKFSTS